ncbi:hypothetical protein LEP1GSC005_1497 [Leptospira santarosai str. ST188]|nr:hypothetical protein LEP1GSC005_1497 [Leptospira santarosai str. ST188]
MQALYSHKTRNFFIKTRNNVKIARFWTNSKYFLRWFSERTETRIFDFQIIFAFYSSIFNKSLSLT